MKLTIILSKALICIGSQCHPALVGKDTPLGTFPIVRRYVQASGYGGDVLQFHETAREIYAIHRVWLGNPRQKRAERLASGATTDRRFVTNGCVNVSPEVYSQLVESREVEIIP